MVWLYGLLTKEIDSPKGRVYPYLIPKEEPSKQAQDSCDLRLDAKLTEKQTLETETMDCLMSSSMELADTLAPT